MPIRVLPIYNYLLRMCTFFARCAALVVLIAGCSRNPSSPGTKGQPVPRADTIVVAVPVIRLTTTDTANGSARLDSASLELLERRVMSRVASMLRAESRAASGIKSAGIPSVKNNAPEIRHGLLGTITFAEDGTVDASSRERMAAIAKMLDQINGPLEFRATSVAGTRNIDIAIARARRVYVDLVSLNNSLTDRDVRFSISSINSLQPINPQVEIFWSDAAY
jgi:hypothetical protein